MPVVIGGVAPHYADTFLHTAKRDAEQSTRFLGADDFPFFGLNDILMHVGAGKVWANLSCSHVPTPHSPQSLTTQYVWMQTKVWAAAAYSDGPSRTL